jgi:arginyl-tRNA synthetase
MGMVLCELKREKPDLPYFHEAAASEYPKESPVTMEDLERLYPQASARYKSDEAFARDVLKATAELQQGRTGYRALWKHFVDVTIREIERDFGRLGIHFDTWLGESFYEDKMPVMVERLKKEGHAQISEGAWTIPLATEKDPELPPLILVKSGGGYLYHTSDLATVEYRADSLKADLALYVVDKRQSLHFKQVFLAARKAGLARGCELVHAAFGTMNGKDGKPFKTRAGGTIKLKDLLEMVHDEAKKRLAEMGVDRNFSAEDLNDIAHKVGIATLKYSDLKNNRVADYVFDLDRFSQFEGTTGPYLLYAAVRIKSILKKTA